MLVNHLTKRSLRWWSVLGLAFWLVTFAQACNPFNQPLRTVKVGLVAPFSGRDYDIGEDMLHGVKLATAEWNQRGGANGYIIELVAQDDRASAEGGLLQARKMVVDTDVIGVIGHPSNPSALAALDIYHQASLAVLVVGANATALTATGYSEVHLVNAQGDDLATAMVDAMKRIFNVNRIALVGQSNDDEGLCKALEQELSIRGLSVVVRWELDDTSQKREGLINQLALNRPDMVVFFGDYLSGSELLTRLRQQGLLMPFLGGPKLARSDFARLVGPEAKETYYVTYVPEPPVATPQGKDFTQKYQASTGLVPRQMASLAYDATNLLLRALETETKSGKKPTRQGIAKALRQLGAQAGASGPISFDENGANVAASVFLYKLEAATYPGRLIAP